MKMQWWAGLLLLTVAACGCPYRMHARLPVIFETLHVAAFENRAAEPWLGYELTRRVKTAVIERTGGRIAAAPEGADRLEGVLLAVGRDIIAEDSIGQALSERLTVEVNVRFEPRDGAAREFHVIGAAVYERGMAGERDRLLREALQDASIQIVNRLIQRGKREDVRQ
jgi:hypothetical protein